MAAEFDLARVNKNAAQFDMRKLEAINGDKIRALEPDDFAARITPFLTRAELVADPPSAGEAELIAAGAPLIQPRIGKLSDAVGMLAFLFVDGAGFKFDPDDAAKVLVPASAEVLAAAEKALGGLGQWTHGEIEDALRAALLDELGLKPKVAFAPVRVAVTGRRVSPPLFESIELLGRDRTLRRLAQALAVARSPA
jgi:glutamyl-tRNA synthetase